MSVMGTIILSSSRRCTGSTASEAIDLLEVSAIPSEGYLED